jgi:PIN domain nuclease of toxin-antitoxin system
MRILLDTHVLLWALVTPQRLADDTRTLIETVSTDVLFSAASIHEIAIKASLGRTDFAFSAPEIVDAARSAGFVELPILASAAARVARLTWHHRDPFDRLLVAQALDEPARLFTADRSLVPYSDLVTLLR